MIGRHPCATLLAVCVALAGIGSPGAARSYDVVDLGTLGGTQSTARGISAGGLVAGDAKDASSVQHAALWDGGVITDLGAPRGFVVTTAVSVNDTEQVAANAEGNPQAYRAYVWADGRWTELGVLDGRTDSIAAAIDSSGRIAGTALTLGAGDDRGFVWESGTLIDLGTLGAATQAKGMNDDGAVTGWSLAELAGGGFASRAFLWKDNLMTDLGVVAGEDHSQGLDVNGFEEVVGSSWHVLGSQQITAHQATLWRNGGGEILGLGQTPGPEVCISGHPFYTDNVARATNDCGQIVGSAQCVVSGGPRAAFLWEEGVMYNLDDLIPDGSEWKLLSAEDVNDDGQIVGIGIAPNGELHAYRLDPSDPVACGLQALEVRTDRLTWKPASGASAYDVVQGDLETLRATSGDFAAATEACLVDDHPATVLDYGADPTIAGEGFWFLVRSVEGPASGSYDEGSMPAASRDSGIEASNAACP